MVSKKLATMPTSKKSTGKLAAVSCPKCDGSISLRRAETPHIDESGFESYCLECPRCDASLRGIIDPADVKTFEIVPLPTAAGTGALILAMVVICRFVRKQIPLRSLETGILATAN